MELLKRILAKQFWIFSIVAVIFLAPSAGLITLTIPDAPYGTTATIPDIPHIGKRASDDSLHVAHDAAITISTIHQVSGLTRITMNAVAPSRYVQSLSCDQIRAPPAMNFS